MVRTPPRLGRIQGFPERHRDERVLQPRAHLRVRVHVTRRDRRHPEPAGEALPRAVALLVLTRVRALQLDAQ